MMKFDNLLIFLAMLALLSATAVYGDPLNPGMLGEGMDMPLPPDLIQKAIKAGVITSASQVTGPLPSGSQPMNLGTPAADSLGASTPPSDAGTYDAGTAGPVNAGPIVSQAAASQTAGAELNLSGTLSLVLQDSLTRYLNLALVQNGNAVAGQGDLTAGGSTQEVAANGLVAGGTLNLTVTPAGSSDLYRLDLRPDGNTLKGSYSIQSSASGETISGTAVGVTSSSNNSNAANVGSGSTTSAPSNPVVSVGGAGASSDTSAKAGPVQLGQGHTGGSSFSSSKSISMSMNGGGSMMSSTSSTSF